MAGREGEAPQAASGGSGQQPRPASLAEGAVGLESGVTQAGGGIGPATLPASGQWLGGGVGYQTGAARSSGGAEFSPDRLVGGSSEVLRSLVKPAPQAMTPNYLAHLWRTPPQPPHPALGSRARKPAPPRSIGER